MKLLRGAVCTLLVCCSALWVVESAETEPPPPGCDSQLVFSSDLSTSDQNENIHRRSLSPWSWRSSTVMDRIPATLWEAQCSSSSCSDPDPAQNPRQDLNSVPIYQNVLVLTRQAGTRCYTASYRSVAVGCTCVWAQTDQS